MCCDAHKDVSEVADDIDFGDATALDQGVGDSSGAAAARTAGKEPVPSPDGDRAYGSLACIVVDRDAPILKIATQLLALVVEVLDRHGDVVGVAEVTLESQCSRAKHIDHW